MMEPLPMHSPTKNQQTISVATSVLTQASCGNMKHCVPGVLSKYIGHNITWSKLAEHSGTIGWIISYDNYFSQTYSKGTAPQGKFMITTALVRPVWKRYPLLLLFLDIFLY